MKIIKRNGSEAVFDIMKIISAVTRANNVVEEADRLTADADPTASPRAWSCQLSVR